MRVGIRQTAGQAHGVHDPGNFLTLTVLVAVIHMVNLHRLKDAVGNGHSGVQRGEGVLEDHLHSLTQSLLLLRGGLGDIRTVKEYLAAGRLQQMNDAAAKR